MTKPIYLLLYSGGVDSILCLKKLIDKGIVPYIFHFWTTKLKKKHEKMIRATARLLSPKSPFYVFRTSTENFEHGWNDVYYKYWVLISEFFNNYLTIYPIDYADYVVTGIMKHIYVCAENHQMYNGSGNNKEIIERLRIYNFPYIFPLANYTRKQADQEFQQLPLNIRQNTVSTTRNYNYGGGIFVQGPT